MKTQITRRQWFLFALPVILGATLWQVTAQRLGMGSVRSSVGDFSEKDENLADTTAIRELARLMKIYPQKRSWAVHYSVYEHWELSYNKATHLLAHTVTPPLPPDYSAIPRNDTFSTTPQDIQDAAKKGQDLSWYGFHLLA